MLKKTALNERHRAMGARMVDFGGFDMPVIYTNQIEEHHAVRKKVGLFDVSHMGEISIIGKDAFGLIQKIVSRDISEMKDGQIKLAVMCNEDGGIIDDLMVCKFSTEKYWLVVNAGTKETDFEWVKNHAQNLDVQVENISPSMSKLDLQGPMSEKILQKLTNADLSKIKRFRFKEIEIIGVKTLASRSGYTGEDGFELYFLNEYAEKIWQAILDQGNEDGILPCGLGSRDTLRTECAMMLYGHDINSKRTPLESVYSWAVSFDKDFIGKESLEKQKQEGVKEKLIGFEMLDRAIAREHYHIFKNGQQIGEVTSGAPSPTLGKNIGMAYVATKYANEDEEIEIQVRNNMIKAKIVKMPFYKKN